MWTYNGRTIRVGKSWTDDSGVKHPSNWTVWDDDTKEANGLVWVDDPAPFDNRFYWSADNPKALDDVTETVDGEETTTAGLKNKAIEIVKAKAAGFLAKSDWKVVKASEVSDYTVDSETLTYRAAVRTASNTIESSITNAADHAAFMALYDTPVDADGNATGNAPINDWPDEI